jgi:hypothetical protein
MHVALQALDMQCCFLRHPRATVGPGLYDYSHTVTGGILNISTTLIGNR